MNQEYININGVEHFFVESDLIEDKPVVLYVHGGPGLAESLIGWEISGRTADMVNWVFYDQRGAGRTFIKSPNSLVTYEEIYSDLCKVVEHVYNTYNKKIFIMAHGWGTVPAIKYVHDNPEYAAGYIGYGQVVDMINIARIRCNRVKELALMAGKKGDARKVDKIGAFTNGTFSPELLDNRKKTKLNVLLSKYNVASGADKMIMKKIPSSPIYDMADLKIMMSGQKISYKLREYMKTINLFEEDMEYKIPMMFINGDWDYQNPYVSAVEYMDKITAPVKKMSLLKDVSSQAMFESPVEFWDEVIKFIDEVK